MMTRFRLAPLKGKYYGTEIIDTQEGSTIATIWVTAGGPSPRELEAWGDGPFEAHDTHYESQRSYELAHAMIDGLNRHVELRLIR